MRRRIDLRACIKKIAAAAALILSTTALSACGSSGESYVLHYSTYSNSTSDQSRTVQRWAAEVEKETDGGVKIEFHYSASLVGADESIQAAQDGRADLAQVGSIYAASDLSMFTVIELPFETKNPRVQMTAIERLYQDNETYREDFDRQGVQLLFPLPLGINLIGTKRPVTDVDGLRGLSIRSGGLTSQALVSVGANPVAMTATDIYESMERGVVGGYTALAIANLPTFGLANTTPYVLDPGIGAYSSSIVVMNEDLLSSMPTEYQKAIEVASSHAIDIGLEEMDTLGSKSCQLLTASGAEFNSLPADQVEQWKSTAKIDQEWVARYEDRGYDASSVLDDYRRIIDEETRTSDYADPLIACMEGASQ